LLHFSKFVYSEKDFNQKLKNREINFENQSP
jgi:hypothetical protein